MIIGISGKKGSGKDTVAKILQYFTLPEEVRTISIDEWVYELSYHETVSDNLSTYLEIHKFADKLKDCTSLLLNIPRWKLELEEYKQQKLPEQWDRWVLNHEMGASLHQTYEEAKRNKKNIIIIDIEDKSLEEISNEIIKFIKKINS